MKCSGCDREATRILVDPKTAESIKLDLDRPGAMIECADPKACKAFCNDCWDTYLGKPKYATFVLPDELVGKEGDPEPPMPEIVKKFIGTPIHLLSHAPGCECQMCKIAFGE